MKQCPNCKTTYTDDSLQFCLADGASLIPDSGVAETVQMSLGGEPMRVSIPQNSMPTVFAVPTPLPANNQPAKKILVIIIVCIVGFFALLAIAGIVGFVFYKQSGEQKTIVAVSPTPTDKPSVSPTVASNDETAKLKEEMANLQKQLQDQKNQKPTQTGETLTPPKQTTQTAKTARANSPRDGFLALRSEPNSETGYRIAQIPHGATLTVLACPKPSNVGKMSGRWCQVIYNGQSGWAFDAFMTF